MSVSQNDLSVSRRRGGRVNKKHRRFPFGHALAIVLILAGLSTGRVNAQSFTTLASFTGGSGGYYPEGNVTLVGSTLYGTTTDGGANSAGTIFSLPLNGGIATTLVSFSSGNPVAGLTLSGSTFYGTTNAGGTNNDGTVFSIPVGGSTPTPLASFNGTNGSGLYGKVIVSGSTLYGTTVTGGTANAGTVFSLPAVGGSPTVLASFNGTTNDESVCSLTLSGSVLYGTTFAGGPSRDGTIFSVPVGGGPITTLASFNGMNGAVPYGGLTLIGSTLYGITTNGGVSNQGTVFSIPVGGGSITTLCSFNGTDGANPYDDRLTLVGSTLYGTTAAGGARGEGTIFSLPIGGGTPTTLVSFNGTNGDSPYCNLTLIGSSLYGTTPSGGTSNGGTVFALNVSANSTADQTNNTDNFGVAVASQVLKGTDYSGLASHVTATIGRGGGPALDSAATILTGTNSGGHTGGTATVAMSWRTRTLQEAGGTGLSNLISDVLDLSGMSNDTNSPAPSDPFVLQMSYDAGLLQNEAKQAAAGAVYLDWLNSSGGPGGSPVWQNAVLGNSGNNATAAEQGFLGSFATFETTINDTNIGDYIGAWGIDPANHDVWAVLDHNSDFAVVPEPSSVLLAILGAMAVMATVRIRRPPLLRSALAL